MMPTLSMSNFHRGWRVTKTDGSMDILLKSGVRVQHIDLSRSDTLNLDFRDDQPFTVRYSPEDGFSIDVQEPKP